MFDCSFFKVLAFSNQVMEYKSSINYRRKLFVSFTNNSKQLHFGLNGVANISETFSINYGMLSFILAEADNIENENQLLSEFH